MKLAAVLGCVMLAAPAMAQTPDRFCEGLAAVVTSAQEVPAFLSLAKEGPGMARPAGMEGAHTCDAVRGAAGKADKLVCTWLLGDVLDYKLLPSRVKACAAVKDWTDAPMAPAAAEEARGVLAARLIRPGSTLEVVALSSPAGRGRVETLTVLAPKKP